MKNRIKLIISISLVLINISRQYKRLKNVEKTKEMSEKT